MFTVHLTSMMQRCSSPLIPCCIIGMLCIYMLSERGPRNFVIGICSGQILFADFVKCYTEFTGFVICRGCGW
jgi:nicotinamide riboside transporter PnuC